MKYTTMLTTLRSRSLKRYKVGLGNDISEAFRNFLLQIGSTTGPEEDTTGLGLDDLIDRVNTSLNAYLDAWSRGNFEEAGKYLQEFTRVWKLILQKTGQG